MFPFIGYNNQYNPLHEKVSEKKKEKQFFSPSSGTLIGPFPYLLLLCLYIYIKVKKKMDSPSDHPSPNCDLSNVYWTLLYSHFLQGTVTKRSCLSGRPQSRPG